MIGIFGWKIRMLDGFSLTLVVEAVVVDRSEEAVADEAVEDLEEVWIWMWSWKIWI